MDPFGSRENTKASCDTSTSNLAARSFANRRCDSKIFSVPSSSAMRRLEWVLVSLSSMPPRISTMPLSMVSVFSFVSTLRHLMAQISPRRPQDHVRAPRGAVLRLDSGLGEKGRPWSDAVAWRWSPG